MRSPSFLHLCALLSLLTDTLVVHELGDFIVIDDVAIFFVHLGESMIAKILKFVYAGIVIPFRVFRFRLLIHLDGGFLQEELGLAR